MNQTSKKINGFTLIEIMVVVVIIAVLIGVAVPNLIRSRRDANETTAKGNLKSLGTACETYAAEYSGLYPTEYDYLSPSYFTMDLGNFSSSANLKDGYYYVLEFGPSAEENGYTVTARCLRNTGNYDYRVTSGIRLERSPRAQDSWSIF